MSTSKKKARKRSPKTEIRYLRREINTLRERLFAQSIELAQLKHDYQTLLDKIPRAPLEDSTPDINDPHSPKHRG